VNFKVQAQVANLTVNHPKAEKYLGLANFHSNFGQVGTKLEPKLAIKLALSWATVKPPNDLTASAERSQIYRSPYFQK